MWWLAISGTREQLLPPSILRDGSTPGMSESENFFFFFDNSLPQVWWGRWLVHNGSAEGADQGERVPGCSCWAGGAPSFHPWSPGATFSSLFARKSSESEDWGWATWTVFNKHKSFRKNVWKTRQKLFFLEKLIYQRWFSRVSNHNQLGPSSFNWSPNSYNNNVKSSFL